MPAEEKEKPLLVRDLMTVGVATCSPDTLAFDIARLLAERNLEAVVVIDPEERHALGIVSQVELMNAYAKPGGRDLKAEEIMRDGTPQVPADIPLEAAAQIMLDLGVRALFIMHHAGGIEYPAAMISYAHFLRHMGSKEMGDLKDLGIQAERKSPIETFIERRNAAREKNLRNQR
jgi:CBS domain-containing protein